MYLIAVAVVFSLFSSCAQNGQVMGSKPALFEIEEEEEEEESFGWWLFDTLLGSDPE